MKKRKRRNRLLSGILAFTMFTATFTFSDQTLLATDETVTEGAQSEEVLAEESTMEVVSTTESAVEMRTNPFSDLLVWTDSLNDFSNFKNLFTVQDVEGEQISPFSHMVKEEYPEWKTYMGILLSEKLPEWGELALSDATFREEFCDFVIQIYFTDASRAVIDERGTTLGELIVPILSHIYDEVTQGIDFTDESYLNHDLLQLKLMDNITMAIGDSTSELLVDRYIRNLENAAQDLMAEDWEEKHNFEFYKKIIYRLSFVREENIASVVPLDIGDNLAEIVSDMSMVALGVDNKFDLYATLDAAKLSGDLLTAYQEVVNHQRGIVGWYYTGVHSEDYDHDTNEIDEGSRIFQEDQLVALKLEERGANFDIRRTLYGLYDEALNKEEGNPAYFRGIKKVVYRAYLSVPESTDYSFKIFLDNELYRRGDFKATLSIKDHGGDELTTRRKNVWSTSLDKNHLYQVEFTVQALNSNAHLTDNIKLKWSYGDVSEAVVDNRFFFVDNNSTLTSKESISIVHLDPIGDADKDGIPNAWEMDGFVVLGNTIRKYDDNLHAGQKIYYTSPVDKSTDGDPYTDLEEVIGANITGVAEAGRHPLIAAYPEIVAELQAVTVNARMVNKLSNTETESTATLNTTGNTTVNKHTSKSNQNKGFTVGLKIEQSIGYLQSGLVGGVKLSGGASVTSSGKYEKTDDSEDVTTTISQTEAASSTDLAVVEGLTQTTDTFKSGDLTFAIKLKNIGSASAYAITPNVSLYVGSEVGRNTPAFTTVEVPGDFYDLSPGQSSQTLNIETRKILPNSNRQLALTVNEEVLNKILNGYPISLQMNNASSKVIIDGETRGDWDDYVNKINGITATINHQDAVNGLKKYKVFAAADSEVYKPQTTVGLGLKNIYGEAFIIDDRTDDGVDNPRAFINDKYITDISVYAADISVLNEFFNVNTNANINIFNLPLRPGMILDVKTSNSDETRPFILNTIYDKGKVSAYVLGNCSDVEAVTASVKINGATRVVSLNQSENNSLLFEYDFNTQAGADDSTKNMLESVASLGRIGVGAGLSQINKGLISRGNRDGQVGIDVNATNIITATDRNGNSSIAKLYIAGAFYIKEQINKEAFGSRYTVLDDDYIVGSQEAARNFVNEHPAQSYVVYKQNGSKNSNSTASSIYSREDVIQRHGEYDTIQGYFGETGDKFRPLYNQNFPIYLRAGQNKKNIAINTEFNNATGFVVMMGSTTRANDEKGTRVIMNDRNFKNPSWDDAVKMSRLYFVKADSLNPGAITGEIRLPNNSKTNRKYNIQIVGYFTEEGYNFKMLDGTVEVATLASNEESVVTRIVDESHTIFEPKGYLIKVQSSNVRTAQGTVTLDINGVKMGQSRGSDGTSNVLSYMIVPRGATERQLRISVNNPNKGSESVANYNIEILGYFY